MSVTAKILIVLNLLLAVVFLGASATFLGEKEVFKTRYENLKAETDRTIADLNENLSTARAAQREAEGMSSARQAELDEQKARMEQKEVDYAQILDAHNILLAQVERISQTARDLEKQIRDLTEQKNALITEKDTAYSEKRDAIGKMNDALAESQRLNSQIVDLNDQLAELRTRQTSLAQELDSSSVKLDAYREKFGELPDIMNPPTIRGTVSGVNQDLNIVMLSVGADDQVKPGYAFSIYRGNQYVGRVVITRVEKDYAAGYSEKNLEQAPIQIGDEATTRF